MDKTTNNNSFTLETHEKILELAKFLKLNAFENYQAELKAATSVEDFLHNILSKQCSLNEAKRYNGKIKLANFPVFKSFETFEFNQNRLPNLDIDTITKLKSCDFIKEGRNIIAIGNSGTGKTHLMTALGVEAIKKGYSVRFATASDIVTRMKESVDAGCLKKYLQSISKFDMLILDEMGYLNYDVAGASCLFQVVQKRYEKKSICITTNIEFSKWVDFLGKDSTITEALVSRLVQNATLLNMNGENYRLIKAKNFG